MSTFHDFSAKTIRGDDCDLSSFAGKVCLVVNVASKCGLTPQYDGLQRLQQELEPRGGVVLGFPCNQFMEQEPGSEAEIKDFCTTNYGVTFPLFSKIEVNGAGRHPLYTWLTEQPSQPDGPGEIAWNFAKFVIGRDGSLVARFSPQVEPQAPELVAALDRALES